MTNSNFEQALTKKLNDLKTDKQPDRDLWAGVELALAKDEGNSPQRQTITGRKLYLLAASVAMFGLIGWITIGQQNVSLTGNELVAALSQQHQQQKNALLVSFQGQHALTENWQDQLTELDDAANAIKKALDNEPNNMALLKMLQSVHQQQINLIERVHSPKWSQI